MRTYASVQYQKTVKECALDLAGKGGFTAQDFAKQCGFRLTPNLRRRLREIVDEGLLESVQAYNEANRLATFYVKPIGTVQQPLFAEIPF